MATTGLTGLTGPPASANDAEIQSGTSNLYSNNSELFHTQDLADEGAAIECQPAVASLNVTNTTHVWTYNLFWRTSLNIGGIHFTATLTVSLGGTSSSTGTSTGAGSATLSLAPNNSTSCASDLPPCVITITDLTVIGTHNMNSSASASNTMTISGDNGDHSDFNYEVNVPDTGFVCAGLSALDDGSVSVSNIVVHVTT